MKKKQIYPPKFRKIIRDYIPKARTNLGYDNFHIDVRYQDGQDPCRPSVAMEIAVRFGYLDATITVYPLALETWRREGDEDLRETIAHEVAHIATQQMVDLIRNPFKTEDEMREKWEALTTIVGRYLYQNIKDRA